jgi:hypothetical protein
MEWGLVKRYVVDEIARLSGGSGRADQEKADALEHCLRLADEVERSRAVNADLRGRPFAARWSSAAFWVGCRSARTITS